MRVGPLVLKRGLFVVEGSLLISEAMIGGWDVLAQYRSVDAAPIAGCDAVDFVLGEGCARASGVH